MLQYLQEHSLRDAHKVLVVLLLEVHAILDPVVVAADDDFHFVLLCPPADEMCALVEEVTHSLIPLPGKGIQPVAVLYGVPAVLPFRQLLHEGASFPVIPLVPRLDGAALYQVRCFSVVVCYGKEVVHARVDPHDPLGVFGHFRGTCLIIIRHQEPVLPMVRLYFRFDIFPRDAAASHCHFGIDEGEDVSLPVLLFCELCRLVREPGRRLPSPYIAGDPRLRLILPRMLLPVLQR